MSKISAIKSFANKIATSDGMQLSDPVILGEISFIPIIKEDPPRAERDYLTLTEALEENACRITEKGTEVAHILFENLVNLPILIEEGEIFQGLGTQDRICVGTIMVQPGTTIEIPVKCVHAPHHLSSGAQFGYGGKASRGMLNEIRVMKYSNAKLKIPASSIDQSRVWNKVSEENKEGSISNKDKYLENVQARRDKAKKRDKELKFPEKTIGVVVVDQEGKIKGVEIHRTARNFKIRKEAILESLESNINWHITGKGPNGKAQNIANGLFSKISSIKEGTNVEEQLEVDGMVINMDGLTGEACTATFYSDTCDKCGKPKSRKKVCPNCGKVEEDSDEVAYMSFL